MTSDQPWWLTWPPAEVAAAILPLFASPPSQWEREARASIVNWCKTGLYKSTAREFNTEPMEDPDHRAVAEAMQVLEHARLLMPYDRSDRTYIGLTRLGMHALQTNTVRQHLRLSDAVPGGGPHGGR
jgi:hypothetical protein